MCRKHEQVTHMWEEDNTADGHYNDDDTYKRPLSLFLKWLYTEPNT